eukprot:1160374-Pelagomonas_calceolata.AAC.3
MVLGDGGGKFDRSRSCNSEKVGLARGIFLGDGASNWMWASDRMLNPIQVIELIATQKKAHTCILAMPNNTQHAFIVVFVLSVAMSAALWLPNVEFIFVGFAGVSFPAKGLVGATASVMLAYIMPSLTFVLLLANNPDLTAKGVVHEAPWGLAMLCTRCTCAVPVQSGQKAGCCFCTYHSLQAPVGLQHAELPVCLACLPVASLEGKVNPLHQPNIPISLLLVRTQWV